MTCHRIGSKASHSRPCVADWDRQDRNDARDPGQSPAWLNKITQPGVRRRAELLYQQMDGLSAVRHTVRGELLAESRKHQAVKILRQIPLIGPLRATLLLALMQTPHRFRSKRQLWTYSGLAVETHDSAQHRYVDGQLHRSKKPQQVRGLNQNHNHEMKEIFKSTALSASRCAGPLQNFYEGLLAKGMKPDMARLTLARKIAAITLTLWKKGAPATPLGWLYESETLLIERGDCRALGAIRIQGTTWLGS